MDSSLTIAALSTPLGQGALAVVRLSGSETLSVLEKCWKGRSLKELPARYASYGALVDENAQVLDDVVLTVFESPKSYTGELSAEVICHGGVLISRRVLERILACGASPAGPGEFTQRAFLNGRLELTQAEAVMDILSAQTDLALKAARQQLKGSLGKKAQALTHQTLALVAHIEAYIDFPEEDISPATTDLLLAQIEQLREELAGLLSTAEQGRLLREGVRTVLVGKPNAGKSSLLNELLGYERAIVSDVAGTTRDTLEESLNLGGYCLRLIDTAGLRESEDALEQAGMRRTQEALEQADLILEIVDASCPREGEERAELYEGRAPHYVRLLNKGDLGVHPDWQGVEGLEVSCVEQRGFKELSAHLVELLQSKDWESQNAQMIAINARHQDCLRRADVALSATAEGLATGLSPEFLALDARDALQALGDITGKLDSEDILGEIFSTFCIGK